MLSAVRQLDYAIVLCEDLDRMKAFYRDLVDFTIASESATGLTFQAGAVKLSLHQRTRGYDPARAPEANSPVSNSPSSSRPTRSSAATSNSSPRASKSSSRRPTTPAATAPSTSPTPRAICSRSAPDQILAFSRITLTPISR